LLAAVCGGVLAAPFAALAQQSKLWRVGFLYFGSRQSAMVTGRHAVFIEAMKSLGYVRGKDYVLEERFADGSSDLVRKQAVELVELKPQVILATGNQAVEELQRATRSIPIVVTVGGDPIARGFAASLARPEGNVTGLYISNTELQAKQLELLRTVLPKLARVAVLSNPGNGGHAALVEALRGTAAKAKLEVITAEARTALEIERGISAAARERAQALLILCDAFLVQQARQIAELGIQHRLAVVAAVREFADAGALMTYGENVTENFRLAADYVDKILRGARPGDLPFGRSQRLYLVINRSTFKALGLAVPKELVLRADAVIE
jgi:putative ABC transport system substrate-binding protein